MAEDVTKLSYFDAGVEEGLWYYGILGSDAAGNASALSNLINGAYDNTPPSFTVSFEQPLPVGTGALALTLGVSEPLSGTPALTITPQGNSQPVAVGLTRDDDFSYSGVLVVSGDMPSGTAEVFASGSDIAGNGFSGTPAGPALVLDTAGPVGSVETNVTEPVQVLDTVMVDVNLALHESAKTTTTPVLRFQPPVGSRGYGCSGRFRQ